MRQLLLWPLVRLPVTLWLALGRLRHVLNAWFWCWQPAIRWCLRDVA